jgi:NADH-quinone oxidoreductase subunit N
MNLLIPQALGSVIILSVGALIVLMFTSALTRNTAALATIGTVTLLVAMLPAIGAPGSTVAALLSVLGAGIVAMLLLASVELEVPTQRPEIAVLLILGAAGGVVFATGPDLLSTTVGMETLSLASITLVALTRGMRPLEAAFKYFVLTTISTAVLIFGLGLIFMATGSFAWPTLASADPAFRWLLLGGVLLVGLGFAYELALVPLHFGAVDAYTVGAPSVTGFVMAASKIAAVIALSRLIGPLTQEATPLALPLSGVLVVIGLISIIWGTFAAIAQRELRRMLAYSAVANAGFLALVLGCGADGRAASIFYAIVYALTTLLAFAALGGRGAGPLALSDVRAENMGALRALALVLAMLSLAGIPPLPGFWTKVAVLDASWAVLGFWPTLIATLGGVFGALYYLRPLPDLLAIVRAAGAGRLSITSAPAVLVAGVAVVFVAFAPAVVYALARMALGG